MNIDRITSNVEWQMLKQQKYDPSHQGYWNIGGELGIILK